jgi:myo-inositol-1(or 4)-monophosphatase
VSPAGSVPAARDLGRLLAVAEDAARSGGAVVAERFARGGLDGLRTKGVGDYVTAADLASEAAVVGALARHTPDVPIVAEETGGALVPTCWVVDPLDGTTNFVRGVPLVAVAVGLRVDGVAVLGVVHVPLLGRCFVAAAGLGASSDGVPLRVADRPPSDALCATGFPPRVRTEWGDRYRRAAGRVLDTVEDIRRTGSSSVDLAWTAAGHLDGFFHLGLAPWDVVPGAVLVREAGGTVTDWDGDPDAWIGGDIVAGSPHVHAVVVDATSTANA